MAWKTPWAALSSFFTSLLYVDRRMEISCSIVGCSGSGDDGAAVSEEVDLVMHGSFSSGDGW